MKAWYPGIFGLFFATCFTSTTWATDCSQETITLNTQAQVDSFQNDFGNGGTCDTVTGSLNIIGPDISNLDALSDLTAIGGDLDIQENDALVNIDSLSKLTGLGNDLFIGSNVLLTHIGLSNLVSVSADVRILGNPLLTDLDELGNLISVGNDIFVDSNYALAQCSGLIPLLDAVDDGEPGPGPGPGGVPDVGSEIFLQNNLVGCNSIEEILNANAQAELDLTKNSATKLVTQAGQIVYYDYEIINTSQVTLHDVYVTDDNVDATPVCAFAGNDELAPAGNPGSTVRCTAQHTVTLQELAAGGTLDNTATVTSDEAPQVQASFSIPFGIFSDGFESQQITTVVDPENSVGLHSSIVIGTDNFPVISYWDEDANMLKVAKCNDTACTGNDETITSVTSGGRTTSIAISQDGFPVISHRNNDLNFSGLLMVTKCNDAACAGGDELTTQVDDSLGSLSSASCTSLAISGDGYPVIAYGSREDNALHVAKCDDIACTGEGETLSVVYDPAESAGNFCSLAIGDDGNPVISSTISFIFQSSLVVTKCNDAACAGSDETTTTLDGPSNIGYTSIAIGTDNNPVISYWYSGPNQLRVAHCNDAACTGNDELVSIVDDVDDVGEYNSIAIGDDGFPVISYFDRTAGALKVAKCNDEACTGGNETTSTLDDPPTSAGFDTSIAIGDDGRPIISYWQYEEDGARLKVTRCGNPACDD